MRFKLLSLLIITATVLLSCKSESEQKSDENLDSNVHKVAVEEVIQTKTYTYLRVTENDSESWLAVSKRAVEEDAVLYYRAGLEMKDFKSKELDRTFETLHFVDNISDEPIKKMKRNLPKSPFSEKNISKKEGIKIKTIEGSVSIAEIFSKRDSYSGKSVLVRGEVVKYNSAIMGRNWVHIQDGTTNENNYDLTITTNDKVKLGDIVTFTGKISLNKDFGAGYSYEVIMEEAKLEKPL